MSQTSTSQCLPWTDGQKRARLGCDCNALVVVSGRFRIAGLDVRRRRCVDDGRAATSTCTRLGATSARNSTPLSTGPAIVDLATANAERRTAGHQVRPPRARARFVVAAVASRLESEPSVTNVHPSAIFAAAAAPSGTSNPQAFPYLRAARRT